MTNTGSKERMGAVSAPFKLSVFGPLIALALLLILGASLNGNFLSVGNMMNVVARAAPIGIIAIGATFVITSGGLDLSVGSMAAFVAGLMIIIMNALVPSLGTGWLVVIIGMLSGLAIGAAAGSANGLLITAGRIEPFIVTLGALGIFRALITFLADGGTLNLNFQVADIYAPVYSGDILGVPVPIIVFAVIAIGAEIILRRTRFGRHAAAIGSSEQVARYSAIDVERVRLMTYVLQGMLVGVATMLYVPRFGSANSPTAVLWEPSGDCRSDHRGHDAQGWLWPRLGHGSRCYHFGVDRKYSQSSKPDQPLSQPGISGRHHHRGGAATKIKTGGELATSQATPHQEAYSGGLQSCHYSRPLHWP
ncbi:ABC transporter permease [Devosia algicola]|uniref:ABC transporter permease n=1 Tax=Devosia algicola TaxID=3026418 RepID=A0ABY7YJV4_9HYPH|nr:ABC transporter permease [Devosia algicola]